MKCPACESSIGENAVFCPRCGHRLDTPVDAENVPPEAEPTPRERFTQAATMRKQDDIGEETNVWEGSFSRLAMVGAWVTAGVLTLAAVVAGLVFAASGLAWGIGVAVVVAGWALVGGYYAYRRLSVHYQLTTQRFLHQRGILWRSTDRIELIDIDDVTFVQGPIERMFDVGTIHISSSDKTDPQLDLPGIENVKHVANQIDDLRRRERRKRGLHVETI